MSASRYNGHRCYISLVYRGRGFRCEKWWGHGGAHRNKDGWTWTQTPVDIVLETPPLTNGGR